MWATVRHDSRPNSLLYRMLVARCHLFDFGQSVITFNKCLFKLVGCHPSINCFECKQTRQEIFLLLLCCGNERTVKMPPIKGRAWRQRRRQRRWFALKGRRLFMKTIVSACVYVLEKAPPSFSFPSSYHCLQIYSFPKRIYISIQKNAR